MMVWWSQYGDGRAFVQYRSRKAALRGDPQEASGVSGAELFPDVPEGSQ